MILQGLFSFIGVVGFCILFKMPKKELFFCGLTGSIGWLVYRYSLNYLSMLIATLMSIFVITTLSRILAMRREMPLTIYAVAGIMPLVPGGGIYGMMYMIITNEPALAFNKGMETIKTACVIAIGMIVILSLPKKLFQLFAKK